MTLGRGRICAICSGPPVNRCACPSGWTRCTFRAGQCRAAGLMFGFGSVCWDLGEIRRNFWRHWRMGKSLSQSRLDGEWDVAPDRILVVLPGRTVMRRSKTLFGERRFPNRRARATGGMALACASLPRISAHRALRGAGRIAGRAAGAGGCGYGPQRGCWRRWMSIRRSACATAKAASRSGWAIPVSCAGSTVISCWKLQAGGPGAWRSKASLRLQRRFDRQPGAQCAAPALAFVSPGSEADLSTLMTLAMSASSNLFTCRASPRWKNRMRSSSSSVRRLAGAGADVGRGHAWVVLCPDGICCASNHRCAASGLS